MRKFFTRLLLMVTLFSVISLVSVAQSWTSPKLTPVDGACTVPKTGQIFTIDFGEAVMPVKGGKISLNASDGTQLYPIQFNWDGTNPPTPWVYTSSIGPFGTVTISGNKVMIDFKATLTEKANYYITVYPGSIKRVSSGVTNSGDWGTAPSAGTLDCTDNGGYKWDFTVGDFTAPSVTLFRPLDESKDVDPAFIVSKGIKIKFNENMTWAPGKSLASLVPGDIALYTTTDPVLGQYGGDAIFLMPSDVIIAADSIVIKWPNMVPSLTNMYVRVKAGLFAEVQCTCSSNGGQTAAKLWGGINTNGTLADGLPNAAVPWNFTTKDTRVPKVSFSWDNCSDTSNFYILIDEGNLVTAGAMVPLNNTNIDAFVTYSGGAFDATVTKTPSSTTIKINPVNKLVSGATTTVGLLAGLWDASQNPIPAKSNPWTNGDFSAPVISKLQSTNPVGTSFDIIANVNEPSTIFYVVVRKSDVLKNSVEYYKPTMKQVVDSLGWYWNSIGDPDNSQIPGSDLYGDLAFPLDSYLFVKTGTNAEKKQIRIWAAGSFNVTSNKVGMDILERVLDLPRTNGMDYVVYAYAIDNSDCGVYNWTDLTKVTKGYITSLLSFPANCVDVLPPIPTMSAKHATSGWCDDEETIRPILKYGPLYVTFNEEVRLADGTPITPESLENIFVLTDNGEEVGINTAASSYNPATKKVTIVPDSAFKSGTTVMLKLLSNKVEDNVGIERNVPVSKTWCVENYCQPLISWTADKYDKQTNKPLHNLDKEVEEQGTIRVVFDQKVYAPADNEFPAGSLTQIVNTPGLINSVSNFIKIGESFTSSGPFNIIYENGNLVNFDVSINDYSGDSTVITIKPKSPYEFGSEMWYNVEVEGTLQNEERYALNSNICGTQSTTITFQVTDHQPPTVTFYEGNASTQEMYRQLGSCVSCNTPSPLDVNKDYRIGVKISEWIKLGFDGMPGELEPSETIKDANAMRRYFSLTKCDGTPVKFDVEDFSIDVTGDVASMYLDPYYPITGDGYDEKNFVAGESYTVKFISNPDEYSEAGPYGPGAFADDHGNIMEPGESCFKVYKEPTAVVCYNNATYTQLATGPCPGVIANATTFSVNLNFNKAMQKNAGLDPALAVFDASKTNIVFATNFVNLLVSNDSKTFSLKSTNHDVNNPAWFVDGQKYYIAVYKSVFKATDTDLSCTWPAVSSKAVLNIGDWVIVDSIRTVDSTVPSLVSKTEGGPLPITTNLVMTWSEKIYPVAGQVVNIYEQGTNTLIASVNVAGTNTDSDKAKLVLPNSAFNTFLQYGKTYYAQFNAGLVKDTCDNLSTYNIPVTDKTSWLFTIQTDPAPDFANCSMGTYTGDKFYPKDESWITELNPTFKITFSEPVVPVANKKVDLYEETPGLGVAIKGNWYTSSMSASSDKKTYTIPYSAITTLTGNLVNGRCYHLNIEVGSFREASGLQTTPKLVSFVTETSGSTTSCTWDFCVGDVIHPTVTFWPISTPKMENIPLNAYLFAQLSEPVQYDGGWAMTEVNAKGNFKLSKLIGTSPDSTWQQIDFNLEFVGSVTDKTRLMFTPLDPAAPDFGTTTNPTMDDDSWYKLEVIQPNGGGYYLEDAAGNDLVATFTLFHTEDITCPVMTAGPTISSVKADGFKIALSLDEAGTVDLKVVKKGAGASGTALYSETKTDLTSPFDYTFTVTGIDATTVNGYEYDVWVTKKDNETDPLATDAAILVQWPYTQTPSWGLETIRIKDLRPSPNVCSAVNIATVKLCDDDKPFITARVPEIGANSVDPTKDITFTLNEPVILAWGASIEHDSIYIRDYENNLAWPAVVTKTYVKVSGKTYPQIVINPTGTLPDQHRFYIEIERYAVRDSLVSCDKPVYLDELIGKTWWFKTKDNTPPLVDCTSLLPSGSCVDKYANLVVKVTDGNPVVTNPGDVPYIDIYEVGSSIPHERISTTGIEPVVNGNTYTFTFPTAYFYLSGKCYTAVIPAKLFKDSFGNKSVAPGCSWSFCAEDYEAPIATWKVVEDFSYMYVARTDPYYEREYEHGDAGETLTNIPTSSFFYVKFHENVEVLDTLGTDTWRDLSSDASFNLDILANALKITNETTGKVLKYGPEYWILNSFDHPNDRFKVIITDDFSHIGYSGAPDWSGSYDFPFGSMMSNATYKIELVPGWISDQPSCSKRRIITDNIILVTATTRNDVPPTLTMKDDNGAVICDADCNKDWTLTNWWSNMTQPNNWTDNCCGTQSDSVWWNWAPEWPGMNHDTICNVCVAASDHITLEFDKAVVKTPVELINMSPFWWEGHGVQWWTEANLGLLPRDFARPDDPEFKSRFIKFQYFNGEGWVDVKLDSASVIDNKKIELYWDGKLVSEGVYAITFAPYTVKDVIRVPDGNEFLGMTCTFKVVDHLKPQMTSPEYIGETVPTCMAQWAPYPTDVDTTTKLAMLFNEPVQPGLPGTKLIIRRENGQQQQIIDVAQITIDTRKWLDAEETIENPEYLRRVYVNNGNFEENTLYYVEVQPGFIADRAKCGINYWDGIDPEDSAPGWQALIPSFEWVFKTGDNTPPEPILLIPNRTNDASRETDLTMIFDENVFTTCTCDDEDVPETGLDELSAPMTWTDYTIGKGFYIYADNGSTPSVEFGNIVEFIPWNSPRVKITGTDIYNGLTSNKVIIDPVTVFQRNMTYYVRVSDSIYCDGFMNVWGGIGDSTTWKFTITNDVAPEISWTSPAYEKMDNPGVTGDYPQTVAAMPNGYAITDLVMAFVDEDNKLPLMVKPGAGNIKIFEYIYNPLTFSYEEKLWKVIPITDPSVEFDGDTVKVHNVKLLDDVNLQNCVSPRMYYVTVEPGAVTNGYPGSLTYWVGFNDAFDWRFYTAPDNTFMMPYTIVKPLGTNLTIPAASTLQMTFAENIEAMPGTAKVKIYKKTGDVLVDEFDPVAANISGNTLTLLSTKLVDETEYYVLVEAGAVGDTSTCSTPFPGILDKTVWTFSTGDNTAPVPTLATVLGTCEKPCVTVKFTFTETFGVTPAAGKINLLKKGVVFASQPATMGANVNEITATFCSLPDTTVFTVALEADVVKDNGNNHISNVAVANPAWTFKTADNTVPAITEWLPVVTNAEKSVTISVKASEVVDKVAGKKVTIVNGTVNLVFDVADMVTADGGKTWTKVVDNLLDKTTYTVTVEAGAFRDKSCAPNPTALATTWTFTTDDNTVPTVIPVKPVQDEILGTYHGLSITFNLSEPVKAGTGNITITRGTNVVSLPVGTEKVVIDATGTKVTLVTPDMLYFGQVTVNVPAGAFVDMAANPNGNVAKVWFFWITDTSIAPNCLTIMSPKDGAQGVLRNADLIMKFCEWMAPGDPAKLLKVYEILEIQGQLPQNKLFYSTPVVASMINKDIITVPVANMKDNTGYTVMIDFDAIRDEAGNKWEGILDPVTWNFRTGDNTPPTVTLVPPTSSNNKNTFTVNAVFSEKVVGAKTLITVTNGTAVISTTDDIVFKIDITAEDGKAVVVTVPVTITDVADEKGYGNPLTAAVSGTYNVGDNTAPTVAITSQPADKTNTARNFNVVLTFSEKVSGVAAALAGSTGMVGVTSTDDIVYTVAMSGADETQVKLVLDKTKVKDVSLNQNVLKDGVSETYTVGDWAVPVATVVPASKTDIRDAVFNVTVTFNEDVIVPATGGFVVTGGTLGTPTNVGLVWTLPITALDGANVKLELNTTITDDSKNKNPLAYAAYNYSFGDRTRPTVEVVSPAATDTVNTFDVVIRFSESVSGANLTNITLTGKKPVIKLREVVPGLAYEATLTGADGDKLTLAFSDGIKDLAGNKLVPASFVYTIADLKAPTVVANPSSGLNLNNDNTVMLKFSEDVVNVLTGVTVTGAKTSAVTMVKDSLYQVVFNAADLALVKINVGATVVDLKGNAIVPVSFMYEIGDHVKPTVVAVPAADPNAKNKWDVVLTFSEAVHIPDGAITVTGAESFTLNATTHTVSIVAKDAAVVKLSLSNAITDKSLNANKLDPVTFTYTVGDNTAPTVTAVGPVPANNTVNKFNVTLTFSEEVTGVAAALAGSTGVTGVTPSADGKTYVVAMEGVDLAKLKLVLDKALVKDVSANKNPLAEGLSLDYTVGDHVAPTAVVDPATADKAKNKWNVTITFSEAVNVPAGAISVSGGKGTVTNAGNVYTVAIEAVDLATVKLSIANTIADVSLNANKFAGAEYTYKVGDNTAPTVKVIPPTAKDTLNTFNVDIIFSEPVTGVNNTNVYLEGGTTSNGLIELVPGLAYRKDVAGADKATVKLVLSADIKDLAGNSLGKQVFTYTIGDHVAPTLLSAVPASGTGNLKNETKVKLTFSEDVLGVPAAITVNKGTVVTTGSGTVYEAVITAPDMTTVILTISNAVADVAGNKFAGATLNYTVGDNTAPKLVTWTPNGTTTEDNHPVFVMTFDENVVAGDGSLYVYQEGVAGAFVTVPVTAAMVNGKVVTVVYDAKTNGALDKSTKYYVLVDAGALKDASGNKFAGVADKKAWTFTTGPKFATSATDLNTVEFKVYPNPFNGYLQIQNNDKLTRMTITNIAGQRVMDVQYPERVIRTENLVSGVYVVTLFTQDGIAKSERIVKR